jgi:hypothetical protein
VLATVFLILNSLVPLGRLGQPQTLAWWVTWTLRPTDTEVEGIPVRILNRNWLTASLIVPSVLPEEARQPGERPDEEGLAFSIDADLDGDSQNERAVVGVYESTQHEIGRFLLILGRAKGERQWKKKALFTLRDAAPFSALKMDRGTLHWYGCLECDDVCAVARSRGGFRLRCE